MECPYINNSFSECSQTLNIQNLRSAFELCTDRYQQCPVYRRLRGEAQTGGVRSGALSSRPAKTYVNSFNTNGL